MLIALTSTEVKAIFIAPMTDLKKLDDIVKQRKIYGDYEDVAKMSVSLREAIRLNRPEYSRNLSETEIESAFMILHKLARVFCGTEYCQDHWDDIANYARIVKSKCET